MLRLLVVKSLVDKDFLARIPTDPGVYLMKDRKGRVIYVGKAKDLRARVRQYFRPGTCTDHVRKNRKRPCIRYQIRRCPAPCVFPIDAGEYGLQVDDVSLFLGGKKDELVPRLRGRMKELAGKQAYEHAAMVRD